MPPIARRREYLEAVHVVLIGIEEIDEAAEIQPGRAWIVPDKCRKLIGGRIGDGRWRIDAGVAATDVGQDLPQRNRYDLAAGTAVMVVDGDKIVLVVGEHTAVGVELRL